MSFEIVFVLFCVLCINLTKSQTCVDSKLRTGKCMILSQCPSLIEEFYMQASVSSMDFQSFMGDSICGFDGSNFLICCAFKGGLFQQTIGAGTTSRSVNAYEAVPKPQALSSPQQSVDALFTFASLGGAPVSSPSPVIYNPLPSPGAYSPVPSSVGANSVSTPITFNTASGSAASSNVLSPQSTVTLSGCGVSRGTTNRVVGGVPAKKGASYMNFKLIYWVTFGAYPWMAALGYYEEFDRNTLKFLCGGSLITIVHVVTSAHCINSQLTLVRLGALDLSKFSDPDAVDIRIKRSIVHELFDLKSIANDIALLELQTPAPMTNSISPICLPESSIFQMENFVGWNPFIAGWGARQHQGSTSNILLDAQVPIVSRASCEQSYRSVFKFVEFSDKLICAGNSNVDACQGDSGGPLMMPQSDGNGEYRFYLLGIVSYGYECARSGFPGVYTRVASYMPWIKQKIQQ